MFNVWDPRLRYLELKYVAVFSSIHLFNNSLVRVLACVYCSFSFHYFFLKELVLCVLPSKPYKTMKPKPFWKYPFWKNTTIHVLKTYQTHQNRRSKQWNQSHMNQTHVKKNQYSLNGSSHQPEQLIKWIYPLPINPWFIFLKPSKPINWEDQNNETKTI